MVTCPITVGVSNFEVGENIIFTDMLRCDRPYYGTIMSKEIVKDGTHCLFKISGIPYTVDSQFIDNLKLLPYTDLGI